MISWASREILRRHAQGLSVECSIFFQSEFEGMLRGTVRHLANRNFCKVLLQCDRSALTVHVENCIALSEILVDLCWVYTSVALLGVHEAFEWTNRFRL